MSVLSLMGSLQQDGDKLPATKPTPIAIAPKKASISSTSTPGTAADNVAATTTTTTGGQDDSPDPPSMPYTCLTCARRKVKCDKLSPRCSTCIKARLDCAYQSPAPRKRKRKGDTGAPNPEQTEVEARLELYEKILKANGLFPGEEGDGPPGRNAVLTEPQWPFLLSRGETEGGGRAVGGKLVGEGGRVRYIGATVFKNLGEDLEPSEDEEEDEEGEAGGETGGAATLSATQTRGDPLSAAFLSPGGGSMVGLLDYHPTYETALRLWKLYVNNVDPLVKALHVPTMETILQRSAAQPSGIPKATEALLFSIYHFGLVSISDEECLKLFREKRTALLARYEAAVRQALVNAQWMRSLNLQVVQAFILFLLSVRGTYDPQTFWILTGCAVRLAQRLGLHRDGDELGLKPFDTQMRRRIFWQLLPLDGIAGQFSGTGICITLDSWTTKQMLNLNDSDIWPSMTHTPEPHVGATDMIFCLARTEMARIIRSAFSLTEETLKGETDDFKIKIAHLSQLEDEIETKYLRYCDFCNPVHQVTMAMSRAGINGGRLRIRLAKAKSLGADLPDEDRRATWALAIKILDYHIQANTNPQLAPFWWNIRAFFQSEALAWVLTELRRDPARYRYEDAWSKIDKTFENHVDLWDQRRSLHQAVGRLAMKAWDATQTWLAQNGQPQMEEMPFVDRVRIKIAGRKDNVNVPGAGSSSAYGSSSNPTPETFQYNPFNPGDSSDDLGYTAKYAGGTANFTPYSSNTTVDGMSGIEGTGSLDGSFGMPGIPGLQGAGSGLLYPMPMNSFDFDFEFNPSMDNSTATMNWMFWDQQQGMAGSGGGGVGGSGEAAGAGTGSGREFAFSSGS